MLLRKIDFQVNCKSKHLPHRNLETAPGDVLLDILPWNSFVRLFTLVKSITALK